jgi:hypothetical protein
MGAFAVSCALVAALIGRARWAPAPRTFDLQLEVTLAVAEGGAKERDTLSLRGGALALNSLADPEHAQLARLLDDLADDAERRRNPFTEDLAGLDLRRELTARMRAWGPSFSAAASLASGTWASEDSRLSVRVTAACAPQPPSTLCFPLQRDPGAIDLTERRARLFAWPIAHSLVLRAADARQAQALATSLRANLDRARTTVALALERSELHGLRLRPDLALVLRATERLRGLLADAGAASDAEGDLLLRIARSTTAGDELPWLQLPEGTVLVVPRLGALATRDLFVEEVTRLAADSHVPFEWVYRGP